MGDLGTPPKPLPPAFSTQNRLFLRRIVIARHLSANPFPAPIHGSRQGQEVTSSVFSPPFTEVFQLLSLGLSPAFGPTHKGPVPKERRAQTPQQSQAVPKLPHPPAHPGSLQSPSQGSFAREGRLGWPGPWSHLPPAPFCCFFCNSELLACYIEPTSGCCCPLSGALY